MSNEGVRVISDGTREGTVVLLDGTPLSGVTEVTWNMNRRERSARVTIELRDVKVDLASGIVAEDVRALLEATGL